MPYNVYGDLYKAEVVSRLQKKGCNVKNVHTLNVIFRRNGLVRASRKSLAYYRSGSSIYYIQLCSL